MDSIRPDGKYKDGSPHHLPVTFEECNLILDDVQEKMNVRSNVIARLVRKLDRKKAEHKTRHENHHHKHKHKTYLRSKSKYPVLK